jgi:hypothetical protein
MGAPSGSVQVYYSVGLQVDNAVYLQVNSAALFQVKYAASVQVFDAKGPSVTQLLAVSAFRTMTSRGSQFRDTTKTIVISIY